MAKSIVEMFSITKASLSSAPLGELCLVENHQTLKYPYVTCDEMVQQCQDNGLSISALMLVNESSWRGENQTIDYLNKTWELMKSSIKKGCQTEGVLPGEMRVKRRAAHLYKRLKVTEQSNLDPLKVIDWVNLYALAVSEENASGASVVAAPTNGSAGIIPAVIYYYLRFINHSSEQDVIKFLLTAGAIGNLCKQKADFSLAESGGQLEVGIACSMAAAGLTEVLGGSPSQCENAAEIGMEHHLGPAREPDDGLSQISFIERNAIAAVTAINSARLALHGDGSHEHKLSHLLS